MKVKRGVSSSLRRKPTFWVTNDFNVFHMGNECRNSILMMCHYPDMGNASDLLCCEGNLHYPIRITTQIWLVKCHQSRVSALVPQRSFPGKTSGGITKCH